MIIRMNGLIDFAYLTNFFNLVIDSMLIKFIYSMCCTYKKKELCKNIILAVRR